MKAEIKVRKRCRESSKKRNRMNKTSNTKVSSLFNVCEHDPIWLHIVVVQTGVHRAQERGERGSDDAGVNEVKG